MGKNKEPLNQPGMKEPGGDGFGDDQGTRVGRPSRPNRESDPNDNIDAGAEGARGIHARGSGEEIDRGPETSNQADGTTRAGSEPLRGREREHVSGYGGAADRPKTSSDQREPLDPEGGAELE
ncbi:MAG TPA: hypothetical protein VJ672_00970 [Gemmatimonadaceae bacterium]|nr:hypothetical protein [Gemmatimonadaceae bacterium]